MRAILKYKGIDRILELAGVINEAPINKVAPSIKTWTAILYAHNEYKILGHYRTKKAAAEAIFIAIGLDSKTSVIEKKTGVIEIDGRHLVIRTGMAPNHGYPKQY